MNEALRGGGKGQEPASELTDSGGRFLRLGLRVGLGDTRDRAVADLVAVVFLHNRSARVDANHLEQRRLRSSQGVGGIGLERLLRVGKSNINKRTK